LFNAIAVHLDSDHTVHPPLIIDANEDNEDNPESPASVDENIDPMLDKFSSGKKLKGKRKASESESLIAILQERYAFEDERNEVNRKAEEEREYKRQRIASEKDDRWFALFAELVKQKE
jgi:hypothetical protein